MGVLSIFKHTVAIADCRLPIADCGLRMSARGAVTPAGRRLPGGVGGRMNDRRVVRLGDDRGRFE
jgi:hypothetical protein